jgi:drug/metabolite transporter (DMT)-like permease
MVAVLETSCFWLCCEAPMPDLVLFALPALIWGTTWLVIKLQLGVVAPEASVAYRFGLASLLLFGWCRLRGISLRFDARTHASLLVLGLLQYAFSYVLLYLSERSLTSGVVAVIFATMVAWNLLGARFFFGQAVPARVYFGAALGLVGVGLVFWPELAKVRDAPARLSGAAFGLLATVSASAGSLCAQRLYARGVAIVSSTAWAMLYASVAVAAFCVVRGVPFTFDASAVYVASLAYLALFGSALAFICYLTLLRRVGAARAGYVAAAIPVLAMVTSTLFEGYRWSTGALAGISLVLAGSIFVLRAQAARSAQRADARRGSDLTVSNDAR